MALIRLILSVSIVIFHNSTFLGTIGYSAVFGFFLMSGYANTAVIDTKYKYHFGKYYLNRCLRILPTYWVVVLIQVLIVRITGNSVYIDGSDVQVFTNAYNDYGLKDLIHELSFAIFCDNGADWRLAMSGFPTLVQQAWSDTIEISFYVMAPFLCMIFNKNRKLFHLLFLSSLVYNIFLLSQVQPETFLTFIYRSIWGSLFLFLLGAYLYYYTRRIKTASKKKYGYLFMITYVLLFALPYKKLNYHL